MLLKGLTTIAPRRLFVPLIILQHMVGFATFEGFMMARQASIGDLYGDEPAELGRALARLQIIWPLASIISPLVGGYLASISVRLPYALTSFCYGLSACLFVPRIPETLPAHKVSMYLVNYNVGRSILAYFARCIPLTADTVCFQIIRNLETMHD